MAGVETALPRNTLHIYCQIYEKSAQWSPCLLENQKPNGAPTGHILNDWSGVKPWLAFFSTPLCMFSTNSWETYSAPNWQREVHLDSLTAWLLILTNVTPIITLTDTVCEGTVIGCMINMNSGEICNMIQVLAFFGMNYNLNTSTLHSGHTLSFPRWMSSWGKCLSSDLCELWKSFLFSTCSPLSQNTHTIWIFEEKAHQTTKQRQIEMADQARTPWAPDSPWHHRYL